MNHITKIGLAVVDNRQVLLVRKRNTSFFILPGGKPILGEDDMAVLSREIREELDCLIDPSSIKFVGTFSDQAAGMIETVVTIRLYCGSLVGMPKPRSEIEDFLWVREDGILSIELAPSLVNSILPFLFSSTPRRAFCPKD